MIENLKVNFKTSVLEWKRKYNHLVEKVDESLVEIIETANIEQLTDAQLNSLHCGDIVRKKTGNMFHCYIVTYKEENHGICLSYFAAGYTETISYDFTDGHWIFNSKDIIEIPSEQNIKDLAKEEIESAENGTVDKVLGLDAQGNLVKGQASGGSGTQLYKHTLSGELIGVDSSSLGVSFLVLIDNNDTPITREAFPTRLLNAISKIGYIENNTSYDNLFIIGITSSMLYLYGETTGQISSFANYFTSDNNFNDTVTSL